MVGVCFRFHAHISTVLLAAAATDVLAQTSTERTRHCSSGRGPLDVTVQEKLRSGCPGPFVKVEGCCG
jgi:hypothetical protein